MGAVVVMMVMAVMVILAERADDDVGRVEAADGEVVVVNLDFEGIAGGADFEMRSRSLRAGPSPSSCAAGCGRR